MPKSVLKSLLSFDKSIKESYTDSLYVIGIDEVGIGCFAGPVVAAAAFLPLVKPRSKLSLQLANLNDSKKLSYQERKELSSVLKEHAHFAIGQASVEEIDKINILQAGFLAMKRAVLDLKAKLLHEAENILVLVDGNKNIPDFDHEQRCIIKGDSQSASIAAASVIAKVFRDELMEELSLAHPQYLWHSNKGYGSAAHREAISRHGLTIWHRRSFNTGLIEVDE